MKSSNVGVAMVDVSGRYARTMLVFGPLLAQIPVENATGQVAADFQYRIQVDSASTAPASWSMHESHLAEVARRLSALDPARRTLMRHRVRVRLNRARLNAEMRAIGEDEA
jgi:hypothetical protein